MAEALVEKAAGLQQGLKMKKSFLASCEALAALCEEVEALRDTAAVSDAMGAAGKDAFTKLQARFSNPKFWQAGLQFFLALEFHLPEQVPKAAEWREVAMQEVDEDVRERAKEQAKLRRLQEDKAHNKGLWSDANTPLTEEMLLRAQGVIMVEEEGRPGMSRDARDELKVVTVFDEDVCCAICQEALPPGSKAKSMPCGHLFHDECLLKWVNKSNSCPMCRFDELPSEKRHFDDIQRAVQNGQAGRGMYS